MSIQPDSPILFDLPEGIPPDADFLERLGHDVLVCHGPPAKTLCPILKGEGCPVVEAAHGIVFQLDLDRPQHRAILARCKEVIRDDVPFWVVARPEQATAHSQLLAGLKILSHSPVAGDLDGLAAEVEAADSAQWWIRERRNSLPAYSPEVLTDDQLAEVHAFLKADTD